MPDSVSSSREDSDPLRPSAPSKLARIRLTSGATRPPSSPASRATSRTSRFAESCSKDSTTTGCPERATLRATWSAQVVLPRPCGPPSRISSPARKPPVSALSRRSKPVAHSRAVGPVPREQQLVGRLERAAQRGQGQVHPDMEAPRPARGWRNRTEPPEGGRWRPIVGGRDRRSGDDLAARPDVPYSDRRNQRPPVVGLPRASPLEGSRLKVPPQVGVLRRCHRAAPHVPILDRARAAPRALCRGVRRCGGSSDRPAVSGLICDQATDQ